MEYAHRKRSLLQSQLAVMYCAVRVCGPKAPPSLLVCWVQYWLPWPSHADILITVQSRLLVAEVVLMDPSVNSISSVLLWMNQSSYSLVFLFGLSYARDWGQVYIAHTVLVLESTKISLSTVFAKLSYDRTIANKKTFLTQNALEIQRKNQWLYFVFFQHNKEHREAPIEATILQTKGDKCWWSVGRDVDGKNQDGGTEPVKLSRESGGVNRASLICWCCML